MTLPATVYNKRMTIHCSVCGVEVRSYPSRPRRFCSKSCARTALNLTAANPAHSRDVSGSHNPMWGKAGLSGERNGMHGRTGDQAPAWKGGRKRHPLGYWWVRVDGRYVLEHRHVAAQKIGRALLRAEVVHHVDGDRGNNTPDNLVVYPSQAAHARHHKLSQ